MNNINPTRGKFWGSSSSDDDSSSTGSSSSSDFSICSTHSTPKVVREFINNMPDPDYDLTRSEDEKVSATISPETYKSCSSTKRRRLSQRVLSALVPNYDYKKQKTHNTVMNFFKNGGSWVQKVVAYNESGPIINFPHLVSAEGEGGWHFCKQADIANGVIDVQLHNLKTGVFVGTFDHNGKDKFSSFFPLGMNPERLIDFFSTAVPKYRMNNRALFYFEDGFYIETYFRNGGQVVNSVFPIFSLTHFYDGMELEIKGFKITSCDISFKCLDDQAVKEAKMFEDKDNLVVDLAKLFEFPNVPSGIYLEINKNDFCLD